MSRSWVFALSFVIFVLSFAAVIFKERSKEWRRFSHRPMLVKTRWNTREYCITCHRNTEEISSSHPIAVFGCTVCHGGDPLTLNKEKAHRDLLGGKNPSDFSVVRASCGKTMPDGTTCHQNRGLWFKEHIKRVENTIMSTMEGVKNGIINQWKDRDLALDHFRKLCAKCHTKVEAKLGQNSHSSGCAACHVIYSGYGTHKHKFTTAIPTSQCLRCHNRSGREGISYVGIAENGFYRFSEVRLSGGRYGSRVLPDIHYELGMHCIDCHTGREVMGDGNRYKNMFEQVEIRCEDCHGSYTSPPKGKKVDKRSYALFTSTFNPNYSVNMGDIVGLTSKGGEIPNLKQEKDKWVLYSKVTGKRYIVKIITGNPKHNFPCQRKVECYSCHSAWSPNCFGCHDLYYPRGKQYDYLAQRKTKGRWIERRGFIRFNRVVLGVNQRGKVSPLIFCQSEVFIKKQNGYSKGPKAFVATAMNPHTTRRVGLSCVDCHRKKEVLGLGSNVYLSRDSGIDFPYPPDTVVVDGKTVITITPKGSRGLSKGEIEKILSVDLNKTTLLGLEDE